MLVSIGINKIHEINVSVLESVSFDQIRIGFSKDLKLQFINRYKRGKQRELCGWIQLWFYLIYVQSCPVYIDVVHVLYYPTSIGTWHFSMENFQIGVCTIHSCGRCTKQMPMPITYNCIGIIILPNNIKWWLMITLCFSFYL